MNTLFIRALITQKCVECVSFKKCVKCARSNHVLMAPRLDLMDNRSLYPQDWLLQPLTYIGLNYVLISKKFDRVLVTRKVNSKLNPTGFDHINTFLDKDINIKWGRM